MNSKAGIVLFLSLGWLLLCSHWYCCWMGDGCPNCLSSANIAVTPDFDAAPKDLETPAPGPESIGLYPISFLWSQAIPRLSSQYPDFKQALLEVGNPDLLLEITGYYFEDEKMPEAYPDMGIARADAVLELFQENLDKKNILIKSAIATTSGTEKTEEFAGVSFKWISSEY